MPPPVFQTPSKKKKTVKVKEQLDDGFLRHSKRISNLCGGFKDAESAKRPSSQLLMILLNPRP
jgi:hypothetical protein